MSTWAEIDRLKEESARRFYVSRRVVARLSAKLAREERQESGNEWRAFLVVTLRGGDPSVWVESRLRVRGKPSDPTKLKLERPCWFRPGAWRALVRVDVASLQRDSVIDGQAWPAELGAEVLAYRDQWLERGAPRVSRPARIEWTFKEGAP